MESIGAENVYNLIGSDLSYSDPTFINPDILNPDQVNDPKTMWTILGLTINEPVDNMAQAIMILMWGKDITRSVGRVGP